MNLWICLFTVPIQLMVEENEKLSEPLDTELGMTLTLDSFMEHLQKSRADNCAVWCRNELCQKPGWGGGRGRWWSWHPRAPSMFAQRWVNPCPRWWHLAPSATKLFARVSMHSACCQCKAWSSAMWEGGAHYTVKIVFISPEASISHATGKNISRICSIHYFRKRKNERSLIPRIPFLKLLPF